MKRILYTLIVLLAVFGVSACAEKEVKIDTTPRLESIVPGKYVSGGLAIISGRYFSETPQENIVYVDGTAAKVTAATTKRLTITLPDHADGTVKVKVEVRGVMSPDELTFTYATSVPSTKPVITSISPATGWGGDAVTITGANFSATAADNMVKFGSAAATVTSASATQLVVTVPNHVAGEVTVTVIVGSESTALANGFTYATDNPLSITSVSPATGWKNDVVTITGANFSVTAADNTVKFGSVTATVTSASATQLVVTVPNHVAGKVDVSVTANGQTVSKSKAFEYVQPEGGTVWYVETVLGSGEAGTAANQGGITATLNKPQGCVIGNDGLLWFAQNGAFALRSVNTSTYKVSTRISGSTDLSYPWGIAVDESGDIWFTNKGNATTDGFVTRYQVSDRTWVRVTALDASIAATRNPVALAFGSDGTLYVLCQASNSVIYKYKDGSVTGRIDLAGNSVRTMAFNADKSKLFLACSGSTNCRIRVLDLASGTVEHVAGEGTIASSTNYTDGVAGDPKTAFLGTIEGMCLASDGILYFSDNTAKTVRALTPAAGGNYAGGTVSTIAGRPFVNDYVDGEGTTEAGLVDPRGLVQISDGSLLLMDGTGHRVRRLYK
ncbi:MAG: IPT/TIG domain-containing protein [Bacteroidales bacterium]|nr:IPT/TIG domain-containing protein [Bacteroidales bacterium]